MNSRSGLRAPAFLLCAAALGACSSGGGGMGSEDSGAGGDGAALDAAMDAPPQGEDSGAASEASLDAPRADITPVMVDVPTAETPLGPPCTDDNSCPNDQRCAMGRCTPWERGGSDPRCARAFIGGAVRPGLQCVWPGAAMDDPYPMERAVRHTPVVANLGWQDDVDARTRPSIVVLSDASYSESLPGRRCGSSGTLRLIDGATCRLQASALDPADRLNATVAPAIGDVDGDGRPDIVAAAANGGLVAFTVDPRTRTLRRLWRSRRADGSEDTFGNNLCSWGGISLVDLDDDGRAEVLFEGAVWASNGQFLSAVPGWQQVIWGSPMIAADVDDDGRVELVDAQGTWEWQGPMLGFVRESYDTRTNRSVPAAHTALADLGDFPGMPGDAPGRPELVSVVTGRVQVRTLGGAVVFDMPAPSGSGDGGPPTVADYDGDGLPEIGVAFSRHYAVFDVRDRRVLWSSPSQDFSSARTGSSVFDFNADGRAEVVYGDECYVRVYDGTTGDVLFSQARFSSTWHENAIVADVDADGSAEVVIPTSNECRPMNCPAVDAQFGGLRCEGNDDCPSARCVEGLCRCTEDSQCGSTYACQPPRAGTAGEGNVCRAVHRTCEAGLRVYRDARDRWAPARGIWNQHAYSVTNVNDDGTVPRTSMARASWRSPANNSFRQNSQLGVREIPASDLTTGGLEAVCEGQNTRLRASVCNRGQTFLDAGLTVVFRRANATNEELCRLRTTEPVAPGVCTPVSCVAPVQARGVFEATADPDGSLAECKEGNNTARGEALCGPG